MDTRRRPGAQFAKKRSSGSGWSVVAVHHPENAASRRIMEKLGMAFERDVVAKDGWPYRLYRVTREEWAWE